MALRLRRGTDAERLTITPEAGEPLYTTDTNRLYIGDGTTSGGVLVGPTLLTPLENIVEDTTPQLGGNLDLNGNNIIGSGNINITGTITATGNINLGDGVEDNVIVGGQIGSNLTPTSDSAYNLGSMSKRWGNIYAHSLFVDGELSAETINSNLLGDDSVIAFNSGTGKFTGSFDGDLTGSVFADNSAKIIDGITGEIFGDLTGDVTGDLTGQIFSENGTLIFDNGFDGTTATFTNQVQFNGELDCRAGITGDLVGSVFADDSSLMVDGTTASIFASSIQADNFTGQMKFINDQNRVSLELNRQTDGIVGVSYGALIFTGSSPTQGDRESARLVGGDLGFFLTHDPTGSANFPQAGTTTITSTGIGYGTYAPTEALDITGNAVITGSVTASTFDGDLTGSLFTDSSTMILDGTSGSLMSANVDVIGQTGNTPSVGAGDLPNVNEWLEITVNGNTRYIPLYA